MGKVKVKKPKQKEKCPHCGAKWKGDGWTPQCPALWRELLKATWRKPIGQEQGNR